MTATQSNVIEGWLRCPKCGKKMFPVSPRTHIERLTLKCKDNKCKEEFEVKILPK